jgi:uncharacterized protein YndB with AHSA1/START domain
MMHEFEVREEISLDATPEQVWEAIATGPGVDSWFMGRNELTPERSSMTVGGYTSNATVMAWEPNKRLATRGDANPDGTFMAFEYLIEGRDGGTTVLRLVHSGFLGDDWQDQYDALSVGDGIYLRKLAAYLKYFPGRIARFNMQLAGPVVDAQRAWDEFAAAAGIAGPVELGAAATLLAGGSGVVEWMHAPAFLGVRTAEGLFMFIHGYRGNLVVQFHCFSDEVDEAATEAVWQGWLDGVK